MGKGLNKLLLANEAKPRMPPQALKVPDRIQALTQSPSKTAVQASALEEQPAPKQAENAILFTKIVSEHQERSQQHTVLKRKKQTEQNRTGLKFAPQNEEVTQASKV